MLIKVEAAGVSVGVSHLVKGIPYMVRLFSGLRRAQGGLPGFDVAGRVEAVGAAVDGIAVGDEVVGWAKGAYVEYAAAKAEQFVPKPQTLSSVEAVALGDSAITALNAVRKQGKRLGGSARADQWGVGRRRNLCGADRPRSGRDGHGGRGRPERRVARVAWRARGDRLHAGRLHAAGGLLRRDARHDRESLAFPRAGACSSKAGRTSSSVSPI